MAYTCMNCGATFRELSDFGGHFERRGNAQCRRCVWSFCGAAKVNRAKREVIADVAKGIVPATVANYSELHDYVDANYYGGAFGEDFYHDTPETFVVESNLSWFWDRLQNEVNAWIESGGIVRNLSGVTS